MFVGQRPGAGNSLDELAVGRLAGGFQQGREGHSRTHSFVAG